MARVVANAHAVAHPSLALVKYWGKQPGGVNLPATSSLGVTVEALTTRTVCRIADEDSLTIDGVSADPGRIAGYFGELRRYLHQLVSASTPNTAALRSAMGRRDSARHDDGPHFAVESHNSFPTAAGLASSASGFAALTVAAVAAAGGDTSDRRALSALARHGSGSAARSIFGGFTAWRAGAEAAEEIFPREWWPEVRIVVLPLSSETKPISSRDAMNLTRDTSPYYGAWVEDAPTLFDRAHDAVSRRDLEALGTVMRGSYLRMFATMLTAEPPVEYWIPASVAVQRRLAELRSAGVGAWETMDAGPQVKVLTTVGEADRVARECAPWCTAEPIISSVGGAARVVEAPGAA
ncbi:MAG: diphosphomevalonate decarboxylase [Alkalispirochaeta sp.]